MPQIKEYRLRSEVQGPVQGRRATAEGFGGATGQGLQEVGKTISGIGAQIQKRKEQQEVLDLTEKMSQAHVDWTNTIAERTQKGELDVEKTAQEYDAYMENVATYATTGAGQEYFRTTNARMKMHFMESAMASSAQLAGTKAKENYLKSQDNYSSSLINDPSSYTFLKETNAQSIDTLVKSGGLPAEAAEKLKIRSQEDLAKSAIRGWIRLNPDLAKKELDEGKWDKEIGGDLKNQMYGELDQEYRARESERARAIRDAKQIKAENDMKIENGFLEKMSANKLTSREVLDSTLDPRDKEHYLNAIKMNATRSVRADPSTVNDLYRRIHLPDGDPNKIVSDKELDAYFGRGLDTTKLAFLRKEIQGRGTQQGKIESDMRNQVMKAARGRLTKSQIGIPDPAGEEQLARFQAAFEEEYAAQRKAGKTANELLNPDSKSYLGGMINNFQRTPQEIISDMRRMNSNEKKEGLYATTTATAPQVEMVEVISPEGKAGRIPKDKLEDALKRGFKTK